MTDISRERVESIAGMLNHRANRRKLSADNENYCCDVSIREAEDTADTLRDRVDELEGVVELLLSSTLNAPEIYREFYEIATSLGKESGLYKIAASQIEHAREAALAARDAEVKG